MKRRQTMEREVKDTDGITWTCVQAYTGLSDGVQDQNAAQVKGTEDTYWVVCTPSGGAKSVRLKLQGEWETSYSDEALLSEIEAQRQQD
jgi:hypothetical protein